MRQVLFPASIVILISACAAVVLFGRHGEYAIPLSVQTGPSTGNQRGVQVVIDGGVVSTTGDRERPMEVWASRPEFKLVVQGATRDRPVLIRNALPLSAYQPIAPGISPVDGTLLVATAPGAYSFRPRAQDHYRFLVLGDPRSHLDRLEAVLHGDHGALFALCLGDLVSDGDPLQYARVAAIVARSPVPVYFTVGNHDLEKGGRLFYRRLFGEENYSFRLGEDRFALLDTAAAYPYLGDDRLAWLDRVLQDAIGARHRFVAFHTPPIDPRPGGSQRIDYPPLRSGLQRVLREHHIPLAFASHIHDYTEGVAEETRYVITGGLGAGPKATHLPHGVVVEVDGGAVSWGLIPVTSPVDLRIPSLLAHEPQTRPVRWPPQNPSDCQSLPAGDDNVD